MQKMNLSLEHTYIITKRNLIRKMNSLKVFTYLCRHFAKMLATFIFNNINYSNVYKGELICVFLKIHALL